MNTDLLTLLDLPAAARLSVAGDELTLLTLTHDHADKITIERRRLGTSIDLGELLQIVGLHGLAEAPKVQITEVAAPLLPAPVEPETVTPAPVPAARRTTRNAAPAGFPCPNCERTFKNPHARVVHQGRAHKTAEPAPEVTEQNPEPEPAAPVPEVTPQIAATPAAATVPLRAYTCTACDTPLAGHERCADCQALLGPDHDAGMVHMTINGRSLCRTCVSYRGTARELLRAPR